MINIKNTLFLLVLVGLFSGCSFKGYEYKADVETINRLNDEDLKAVNIKSPLKSSIENEVSIPLRAAKMTSPYGSSFSDYISYSLENQLKQNDLVSANSNIQIKTMLMKNSVDIWGFSTAHYEISSQFIIEKDEEIVYDKLINIKHTFPSHFVGQIAIENGMTNYPVAVKKLIAKFLRDEDVIKILK